MATVVRPYLTVDPDAVRFGPWNLEVGGQWQPLPDFLPDWDYNTDLKLQASMELDLERLRASTRLDSGSIHVSVSWRSTDGRVGHTAILAVVDPWTAGELPVLLPGERLGPEIDIFTRLVLGEDLPSAAPGVARLAGSVLWEDTTRLSLVGAGSRFPVVVVDFADGRIDHDASWALDIPDDLDTPIHGGLMLMINRRDAALVAAASGNDRAGRSLLDAMYEQVGAQLLEHAVEQAESLRDGVWADGTLGATLKALAARFDGGLDALLTLRNSRPAAYRAALVGEARRNGAGRKLP